MTTVEKLASLLVKTHRNKNIKIEALVIKMLLLGWGGGGGEVVIVFSSHFARI